MSSPAGSASGSGGEKGARLTAEERKVNHIKSERKRREAIRGNFDRLAELVPRMSGQGRSEGIVLKATNEYIRSLITTRMELLDQLNAKGVKVDAEHRAMHDLMENGRKKIREIDAKKQFDDKKLEDDVTPETRSFFLDIPAANGQVEVNEFIPAGYEQVEDSKQTLPDGYDHTEYDQTVFHCPRPG